MAEDLGEVRVNVEQEGAQDAADTIGDAVSEGAADGEGGAAQGGTAGILGGISKKLTAVLGLVAFLASLKPIQEILSGLQRLFSIAILPLVALLTTFLRPILQDLLRFVANLDFDNLVKDLSNKFSQALNELGDIIVRSLSDAIFGTGQATRGEQQFTGNLLGASAAFPAPGIGGLLGPQVGEELLSNQRLQSRLPGAASTLAQQSTGPLGILNSFNEFASSTLQSNTANSNAEVNQRETAGSQ